MSDREFERYLAILGSLLRLSTSRREEIAAELRDHLEERLTELLAQGVTRHQAIVMALEEFGDAAGLAGEFLYVFQRQRRRWVMRMTVGSVAVCVALCLSIMALWPDNRIAPPGAQALAQEADDPFGPVSEQADDKTPKRKSKAPSAHPGPANPEEAKPAPGTNPGDPFAGGGELTPEDNNKRTERKLAQRMKATYPQVTLRDVLTDFAQKYEVDVFVNHKHLENADKNLEEVVELEFKSISGDMLLDLVLRGAGLNYTIQDGIVVVTTSDDLDSMMEVRVYNCRDLIALMHENPAGASQGTRKGRGMYGGMMSSEGAMSGYATGGPQPGVDPAGAGGIPGAMPGAAGASSGMPMPGRGQAMGMGMPGMPGMPAMGMSGMSGMGGMPGMESAGMHSGGMEMGGFGGGQASAGGGIGVGQPNARVPELDALINVLTCTVMPDSWDEHGGPGTIEAYYGGLLIVNNNPQAHRKIDKLLKMIRDASLQPPGTVVREK